MTHPLPSDEDIRKGSRDWPHAPPHHLEESGVYFVTARCLDQARDFHSEERLDLFQENLRRLAGQYRWKLEAWAILPNHYHFVAHGTDATSLVKWIRHLHGIAARDINHLDSTPGR